MEIQHQLKNWFSAFLLCESMLSVACHRAVSVCLSLCPSIRPSRLCIVSKQINTSSKFLSPSGSHTILVFRTKRYRYITLRQGPPNWGRQKSQIFDEYLALASMTAYWTVKCCQRFDDHQVLLTFLRRSNL